MAGTGRCAQCGLPARPTGEGEAFCCVGCSLAWHFAAGLEGTEGSGDEANGVERLEPRLMLSAFLSMGVMVFSLALYGENLAAPEALAAAEAEGGEAVHALRGLLRGAALLLTTPVLHLLGAPLLEAVVRTRRFLSADALVLVAAGAAYLASAWNTVRGGGEVYFETASMVLVLVTAGRLLDGRARQRARTALVDLAPEVAAPACRVLANGTEEQAPAAELSVGERVRVRPGETVPVDGHVLEGRAFVDSADLTGEEEPRPVAVGDRVLAGMRSVDGSLLLKAEAVGEDRVQSLTRSLLEEALLRRGRVARLADRAAGAFLPVVLLLCAFTVFHRWDTGAEHALLDGLSVLLIACPCALGIATPLALWTALGAAWRGGVLVRGGDVLERLALAKRVVFDKTGTLTLGELELTRIESKDPDQARTLAAALELGSEHPIGRALRSGVSALGSPSVEDFRVVPGVGVEGRIDGVLYSIRRCEVGRPGATCVELESEGRSLAQFHLRSVPRPEAGEVLAQLREQGLELSVLTGDSAGSARALEEEFGLPVASELLPGDKLSRVVELGPGTVYVGDGLNDLAALAAADVGIAVRDASPASLRASGVSLLGGGLDALPGLLQLARRARGVARWNLAWAFGYNAIGLGLAVRGELTPVFAATAMVVSSALVVLHSRRAGGELQVERHLPEVAQQGPLMRVDSSSPTGGVYAEHPSESRSTSSNRPTKSSSSLG